MKILYSWLLEYVPCKGTPQELADTLTGLGLSVESLTQLGGDYRGVVVGKVLTCEKVAGSDHLSICSVDAGLPESLPIVCGAPNVAAGQIVPVAVPGAMLPGGFLITERKLRGTLSKGMICSERELGLSEDHQGILVFPDDYIVGRDVHDYLGDADWLFDLEVTFNRPDCLCHIGVAREISAKLGLPLNVPIKHDLTTQHPVVEIPIKTSEWVSVKIEDSERCPRYSARIVKGVTVAPSPLWLQKRLQAVGIRPISNVVDVTNYVMMEMGHPLHAFDYHLVKDGRIVVRKALTGEKFTTLDGKEHILAESDLLIADEDHGIALAGVMGGLNSEINDATRDVLIECAVFTPFGVRITSRDQAIQSESSRRFERGVDPELTLAAATRAAQLIQELAGGEILGGVVDACPVKWKSPEITIRSERVNSILASNLTPTQMRGYLDSLSCCQGDDSATVNGGGVSWKVYPPSWRRDLEREIDLIEEVIRLHGYNEVGMATTSRVVLEPDVAREHERRVVDQIKIALASLGLREAICWSLLSSNDATAFKNGLVAAKVTNPLSDDLSRLRTSLAPGLMRTVERNINSGHQDIRLFEWGKCFHLSGNEIVEELRLGVIVTGKIRPESYVDKTRQIVLGDIRGLIEQLSSRMRIKIEIANLEHQPDYLSTAVKVLSSNRDRELGVFGQISSETALHFGIETPVWYIELNGDLLLQFAGESFKFESLPRFPAATRDLAFIIKESLDSSILADALLQVDDGMLESLNLFDIYAGKGISEGKKSLAFHLVFRRADKTLSDGEVDALINKMIKAAGEKTGAELRSI